MVSEKKDQEEPGGNEVPIPIGVMRAFDTCFFLCYHMSRYSYNDGEEACRKKRP
jgi:hypothetical protein